MRTLLLTLSLASLSIGSFAACGGALSVGDAQSEASRSAEDDGGSGRAADAGARVLDGALQEDGSTIVTSKKDASTTTTTTCSDNGPCDDEGASCAPSPCTDPCQFCNRFTCIGGKWQALEVFPLPPNQCGDTFACGALTCTRGSYCEVMHAGVALPDGGVPAPSYQCRPMDPSCTAGCGCAMNAAKNGSPCQPASCDSPDGGPIVECFGI